MGDYTSFVTTPITCRKCLRRVRSLLSRWSVAQLAVGEWVVAGFAKSTYPGGCEVDFELEVAERLRESPPCHGFAITLLSDEGKGRAESFGAASGSGSG